MEDWKIGEIREVNGGWYQCTEADDNDCTGCDLAEPCPYSKKVAQNTGFCSSKLRNDSKSVIFKKLEKVGEPYEYFVQHKGIVMLQPYKLFATPFINGVVCNVNYDTNTIDLEIKQSKKENMKINRVVMDIDDRDYLLDILEAILHDTHCQQYKDEICEAFSKYIVTETASDLKPFDLESAKLGRPVCTRDRRKARIICLDSNGVRPIVALVTESEDEEEIPYKYHCDGSYNCSSIPSDYDLMMLSEKKEGWINVYKERIYSTKEEAIEATYDGVTYVDTIKISFEE